MEAVRLPSIDSRPFRGEALAVVRSAFLSLGCNLWVREFYGGIKLPRQWRGQQAVSVHRRAWEDRNVRS